MDHKIIRADVPELEAYKVFRQYLEHEDGLINNRVSWFIHLHSFLIASYAIVISAIVTLMSEAVRASGSTFLLLVCCGILAGLSTVGLFSSYAAIESIKAATDAITLLHARWKRVQQQLVGAELLPGLAGGGSDLVTNRGLSLQGRLPRALFILWILSYLVPATFIVAEGGFNR